MPSASIVTRGPVRTKASHGAWGRTFIVLASNASDVAAKCDEANDALRTVLSRTAGRS